MKNPKYTIKDGNLIIESDGNCGRIIYEAKFLNDNKLIISLCLILLGFILLF